MSHHELLQAIRVAAGYKTVKQINSSYLQGAWWQLMHLKCNSCTEQEAKTHILREHNLKIVRHFWYVVGSEFVNFKAHHTRASL